MKNLLLLCIIVACQSMNGAVAQEADNEVDHSEVRTIRPFLAIGVLPLPRPVYLSVSAGFKFNEKREDNRLYGSVYAKAGNIMVENSFHSYFLEMNIILKEIELKNDAVLAFETPVWLACRNFLQTFIEEKQSRYDYTYVQIGSGLDVAYHFPNKLSLFSRVGVGYGPRYNYAGNFVFSKYRFDEFKWLPNADLGIRFDF